MKRLACCLLLLMFCLTSVPAFATSSEAILKYMEYYKATDQMEGIFADFIKELNEQFDEEETLSDVEFTLYFQYAEVFLDLREISMLQSNAAYSDKLESYNDTTTKMDNLIRESLQDAYTKWEQGIFTKTEAINSVRPLLDILITAN